MSKIIFRVPLTQEEQSKYVSQFESLDTDDLGIVTGESLKPFFSKSGLSSHHLLQVWALADTEKQGFLNQAQFSAAMRMIAHLQSNPQLSITSELYQTPAPRIAVLGSSVTPPIVGMATGNTPSIPTVSAHDFVKFNQLFDRSSEDGRIISGTKAKEVFLKAKLPNVVLGSIWTLCDRNNTGSLDRAEFTLAMHLIQLALAKHPAVATLPANLPQYLWNSVSHGGSVSHSADTKNLSASPSGATPVTSVVIPSNSFTNASTDWVLTPEKKQQFDNIFDSLDKNRTGALGADVLVPFFLTSKLSQDTLATVWDLADIHNNPVFTKTEFAIAMFLIQKKNAGVDLPDVVSDQLLISPALGLYPGSIQQHSTQQNVHPTVPSRDTKPYFDQVPPPAANTSSLDELMGLNSSFTPPPGHHHVKSISNNNTGNSANISPRHSSINLPQRSSAIGGYNVSPTIHHSNLMEQNTQNINPQSVVESRNAPLNSPLNMSAQQQLQKPAFTSNLPTVPDFSSVSLPQQRSVTSTDLYADAEASGQLSEATTDLANLSTQVTSLTSQATRLNNKKVVAQQELNRITELKASIESKLASLRASYEQETKQTEEVEQLLLQSRKDTDSLTQQLSVSEENYHSVQSQLTSLQQQLQEYEQNNSQLKEQIGNYNSLTASLQKELAEKQQQVKQQKSMVDVNTKQAELSEITANNLKAEIEGLDEQLVVFLNKRKELDEYQTNIEKQHSSLESKHQKYVARSQELEAKYLESCHREKEVQERTKQIVEQERIYHQQVSRLQELFKDLNKQRESFELAEQDLQQRRMEYTQQVQELSDKQMKFAMGELPQDSCKISNNSENVDPVSKFVEETVTNSKLNVAGAVGAAVGLSSSRVASSLPQDEEGKQDSVFDKDFPTSPSQTEVEEEEQPATAETAAQAMDEGDMNVYRMPRTESVTSSTANNAPQSLRDEVVSDTQEPSAEDETEQATLTKHINASSDEENDDATRETVKPTPGGWDDLGLQGDDKLTQQSHSAKHSSVIPVDNALPAVSSAKQQTPLTTSKDEHVSQMTNPVWSRTVTSDTSVASETANKVSATHEEAFYEATGSTSLNKNKNSIPFSDDAFADLEQASPEDDFGNGLNGMNSIEEFETIENGDLDDELQETGFTGTSTIGTVGASYGPPPTHITSGQATSPVGNDEWEELFSGFGNSTPGLKNPTPQTTVGLGSSNMESPTLKSPVNRAIATTPKSIAIEELSNMGFSEEEAVKALEKCKWDLEAATNFLLDNA
ncbi:Ede1p Ecym_7178 [Eremothecium cymbalariae DBVPG|uniref:EH domain-containing and endocytosis protein 1 n=1 Tax=Eremothecium cymbalariae (strain CBS 270.75 / DBVPG 7215 / KCTC 17166 / NRRL Y-17582) TaxID=931890 RepID=G8JW11_ERECY|nr:hypothetical protein Ecym_7178 [Eremothecium cymbalariae DBVPG\